MDGGHIIDLISAEQNILFAIIFVFVTDLLIEQPFINKFDRAKHMKCKLPLAES